MKVLFDTSVLVAALVERHGRHERAIPWLRRGMAREVGFVVATPTLAELYAVLTALPGSPRISPSQARNMIQVNIEKHATAVPLTTADYRAVLTQAAESDLAGGSIYDGLIAHAAQKAGVDRLLTFNTRDFERVWPEGIGKILEP